MESGTERENGGIGPRSSRGHQDAGEGGREVVATAEGVAAICTAVGRGHEGSGGGGIEHGSGAMGSAARETGATGGEKEFSAMENNGSDTSVELVVEGRGAATATGGGMDEAGTTTERQQHRSEGGGDDTETPLAGIWRCGDHLRAAAIALERLLEIDNSLEPWPSPPVAASPVAQETETGKRNRRQGEEGSMPVRADGAGKDVADEKKMSPSAEAFRLGGRAGTFAFEAEMNRHLLGSSPQHHVHFRRRRAEGPRALMLLAQEAERACGVVRCEDLLGVRRCLLRLFQPPETESKNKGVVVGTATLFARSVAAVCLYRQDMVLGRFDVMWFVAEAMTDVGVPDAVINSPSGMGFLERVGKPVYETLRTLCLNRARQRTMKSDSSEQQDWRTLQTFANTVDDAFQLQYGLASSTQRYMSKWALTEVLSLMHRYLQIGVELQLPSPHEWASTYWYWDYVMTTRIMTEASLRESKEQLEAAECWWADSVSTRALRVQVICVTGRQVQSPPRQSGDARPTRRCPVEWRPARPSKKKKRGGNKAKKPAAPAADAAGGSATSPSNRSCRQGKHVQRSTRERFVINITCPSVSRTPCCSPEAAGRLEETGRRRT
ncbi:unnamed protein product [Scytosiphon promiscuus]